MLMWINKPTSISTILSLITRNKTDRAIYVLQPEIKYMLQEVPYFVIKLIVTWVLKFKVLYSEGKMTELYVLMRVAMDVVLHYCKEFVYILKHQNVISKIFAYVFFSCICFSMLYHYRTFCLYRWVILNLMLMILKWFYNWRQEDYQIYYDIEISLSSLVDFIGKKRL